MIIEELLSGIILDALHKLAISNLTVSLERPNNSDFGDYATSVALRCAKKLKKNPLHIAEEIQKNISPHKLIEKIEVVKPGFINIWISKQYLFEQAKKIAKGFFNIKPFYLGDAKKAMIEFAHPNTHKLFHIGHLKNITIGESIVRIFESVGNTIIRTNYQGDVGLHIAKCMWYIKKHSVPIFKTKNITEKITFLGKAYSYGNKAYETEEQAKKEILDINRMIYEEDPRIIPLWKETRMWSLEYFDSIYKRLYTHYDRLYFESELSKRGIFIVNQCLKKGILEKSKGAIIFNGKKYGLDIRVFINSFGFPTYEGKELGLAEKEFSDYGSIDKCIHVVGPEQASFFSVTFKVEELLDEKKYKNKQRHLVYGWVRLKHGKMSSRSGVVVEGPWLINEAKKKILETYRCDEETAEIIAVASVKYSFLKNAIQSETVFDFEESISLEGNSAPYLLYTFVRTQGILNKANKKILCKTLPSRLSKEEIELLRTLSFYSNIITSAAKQFSPNHIATYLYELAQKYNLFYQKYQILKSEEKEKQFRLLITKSVANIIEHGLFLLGIKTVKKM